MLQEEEINKNNPKIASKELFIFSKNRKFITIITKVFRLKNLDIYMKINNNIFVDGVNLQIIDILAKDSSTTFVEIAKQIGISDATVHLRVRRLIAAGIITKFTISVDNNLLGYDHLAFMGININQVLQIRLLKNYPIWKKYWRYMKCIIHLIYF